MSKDVRLEEVVEWQDNLVEELTELLIDVVADGASVGFMPPLLLDEARRYWSGVLEPGTHLWVAKMEGQVVGTVQLQLAMKANGTHRAEIAKLMVHPASRRHGFARMLMQAAEKKAVRLGRSLLVLDTRGGDPSNLLYRSLGYIEAGRIPKYARSADGELDETVIYYKEIGS